MTSETDSSGPLSAILLHHRPSLQIPTDTIEFRHRRSIPDALRPQCVATNQRCCIREKGTSCVAVGCCLRSVACCRRSASAAGLLRPPAISPKVTSSTAPIQPLGRMMRGSTKPAAKRAGQRSVKSIPMAGGGSTLLPRRLDRSNATWASITNSNEHKPEARAKELCFDDLLRLRFRLVLNASVLRRLLLCPLQLRAARFGRLLFLAVGVA